MNPPAGGHVATSTPLTLPRCFAESDSTTRVVCSALTGDLIVRHSCFPPCNPRLLGGWLLTISCLLPGQAIAADGPGIAVNPEKAVLVGNFARVQLVVSQLAEGTRPSDRSNDLTRKVQYTSLNPDVVSVSPSGELLARGNGTTRVEVQASGTGTMAKLVEVTVSGVVASPAIGFRQQVSPILSKHGCNSGACHAAQYGKGGFKLSVFGFDPSHDRTAIIRERHQRRVSLVSPRQSLFLRKPTLQVPHGGGQRLVRDSVDHDILLAWLLSGAADSSGKAYEVTRLEVFPKRRVGEVGTTQQLRVVAHYNDKTTRDVTAWAKYDSMDESILDIAPSGLVTASDRGQASVMIRFGSQADISMFVTPFAANAKLDGWKNNNFVDELAAAKFRELGIEPSGLCDDATFLRRVTLDLIGTLPSPATARAFIDSKQADKRQRLIDELLGLTGDPARDRFNDLYAAWWTLKWSDLIRNSSNKLGEQGMWALHNWVRESFRTNKSFDRFVGELITAKGSIYSSGPANYFRINGNANDLTESTAQLFLGIRLECAKCHHHPFEKYSQGDYNGFAAFFKGVGTKSSEEFGLFGRESVVVVKAGTTGKATPLGGEPVEHPLDLRIPLAKWLTSKQNRFFSQNVVNRYVSYLLGRGLVEPVDDLRSTNPPTNVALMDALSKHFVESNYDLKSLLRAIVSSRLYQISSQPTKANVGDTRFYSYYQVKRLAAESLLDAVDEATGVKTKFKSLPLGTRAIELPDAGDFYSNYFLKTFAKPKRASVCECERSPDENLAQALHTLNGDTIAGKVAAAGGRVGKLLTAKSTHDTIIEELYLATLSRRPSPDEQSACREFLAASPNPKECYEDLLWALLNSKQFLFVH